MILTGKHPVKMESGTFLGREGDLLKFDARGKDWLISEEWWLWNGGEKIEE